jgi:hypothetical protein
VQSSERDVGEEGFIILLDVLGTRGYWLRTDPKKAIQNFSEIVDSMYVWKDKLKNKFEMQKIKLRMSIYHFSDTIMISLIPDSENKLKTFLNSSLLISSVIVSGIDSGILLRGTISYGKFYRKREEKYSFIVGPAIDEAAEWYDKGQIIGAFCSPSLCFGLDAYNDENKINSEFYLRHPLMLKDGRVFESWVLNWPVMISYYLGEDTEQNSRLNMVDSLIKNKNWVLNKFSDISIGTYDFNKFENTMKFYETVVKKLQEGR